MDDIIGYQIYNVVYMDDKSVLLFMFVFFGNPIVKYKREDIMIFV